MFNHAVEPVIGVPFLDLPARSHGVEAAERVIVVIGGDPAGEGGEQPVPVVVERGRCAVYGLGGDVVVGIVGVGLGDRAVLGDLGDAVAGVVGVGQGVG